MGELQGSIWHKPKEQHAPYVTETSYPKPGFIYTSKSSETSVRGQTTLLLDRVNSCSTAQQPF